MKKTLIVMLVGLLLGTATVASAKSEGRDNKIEQKIERLREQMEKRIEKMRAQNERKISKIEDRHDDDDDEDRKEKKNRQATSTQPFILEIGGSGNAHLKGHVVAQNASTTLSVRTWGGVWSVRIASTTRIESANRNMSDFKVGDYVSVSGSISTTSTFTINARQLHDKTR